ncbi:putative membrane protein [Abditibacterium utsteinense]|uniref:Putative membrane protein n=1 Tax=Abditibacterium utsteinense TaxID=1960156 RepID=A0A2S8SUD5_9BACT|nr:DUF202 domain-containing protein [Abditibacterium utsteinense]PQV64396.1 putative membrane protein [Abditibacterium utsteinense]
MEKPSNQKSNPNRTRDHLANERTYLAWMRTAIALLGFGIVIVRLRYGAPLESRGPVHGWELGLVFCAAGLLSVVGATLHFFHVQNAIENENYEPEKRWIVACSALVVLVGIGVIWYLIGAGSVH